MGRPRRGRPAPRLGREMKSTLEPLFQWRRGSDETYRRVGLLTPAAHHQGRLLSSVALTTLQNPAFLLFTPATEDDGTVLDIKSGDLFVRLQYLNGDDTTDEAAMEARHQVLTVHGSPENKLNSLRVLGELES